MTHLLAIGSGINLKTGKEIPFSVSQATSIKGLEGLAKNVLIQKMAVISHSSHEKITELLALKRKTSLVSWA